MHIIACINYQDQGVYVLLETKEVWRLWFDYGINATPTLEHCIDRDIPYSVTIYFKNIWPSY